MKTGVRVCVLLAVMLAVSACGKKEELARLAADRTAVGAQKERMAPADVAISATAPELTERLLSYKHQIAIEMPAAQIEPGLKALQAACQAVAEQGCLVMESSFRQSYVSQAHLVLSVRRRSVEALRTQAGGLGKLTIQSTEAEDVTGAVADGTRRMAMNKALRDDLLDLRKQSRGNIEALIKATEKLAEVQAEIESTEAELATLHKRVLMDQLTIDLTSNDAHVFENHPVKDAVHGFVDNLATGLGGLIMFLALALPWLLLVAALPFIWRGLRRIWKLGRRQ